MRTLFTVVFLLSCVGFAEDKSVTVCIGRPASDPRLMVNENYQQAQLVHQITGRGQNKKAKVKMSAVALEGSSSGETSRAAKDQGCDYIVVWEFEAVGGSYMPQVGSIPTIGSRDAARRSGQIGYSITEVQSGRTIGRGLVPLSWMNDAEETSSALQATRDMGNRVFDEITRARARLRVD